MPVESVKMQMKVAAPIQRIKIVPVKVKKLELTGFPVPINVVI